MFGALIILQLGFTAPPTRLAYTRASATSRCAVALKNTPDDTPEIRPDIQVSKMSVVEFHDDNKKGTPVLGLVEGAEYKAKGGARIMIIDASGSKHTIKENSIHINLGVYKGKLVEPSDILKEYNAVMQTEASKLGVDVIDLEMAWELCAEEGHNFSAKGILSLVDESFFKSTIDKYKAFRLLTSDIGHIFFKKVSNDAFKPKAQKSVQASKEQWCREQTELDWCFV
jgi:hypothetical protein